MSKQKIFSYTKLIAVLVVVIVGGYYLLKVKSGGELAANFVSLEYRWGTGDSLQNSYNSKTGEYRFLDKQDKMRQLNFKFRANNVIFLNSLINKEALFDLPDTLVNDKRALNKSVLRYEFTFVYDHLKRHIIFYTDYDRDLLLRNKAVSLQKIVQQTIDEAQERYGAN